MAFQTYWPKIAAELREDLCEPPPQEDAVRILSERCRLRIRKWAAPSHYFHGDRTVYLDGRKEGARLQFDALHELGHWYEAVRGYKRHYEDRASFLGVAAVCLPDELALAALGESWDLHAIIAGHRLRVSAEVVARRAVSLLPVRASFYLDGEHKYTLAHPGVQCEPLELERGMADWATLLGRSHTFSKLRAQACCVGRHTITLLHTDEVSSTALQARVDDEWARAR